MVPKLNCEVISPPEAWGEKCKFTVYAWTILACKTVLQSECVPSCQTGAQEKNEDRSTQGGLSS